MLPSAIIFVNNDLTEQVVGVLKNQLFLDQVISGEEFDGYVLDPNYLFQVRQERKRILVVRSFLNLNNKDLADIVIFIKLGLASIQKNNFGPPLQTYQVATLTLIQLLGSSPTPDIST